VHVLEMQLELQLELQCCITFHSVLAVHVRQSSASQLLFKAQTQVC
jgi:hypothetical protein